MTAPSPTVSIQGQGVVPADQLNTYVQTVVNYPQLRTFSGLNNMVAYAQGAASPGDGGQGFFWYNSTSTAADNNSTVIVPSGNIQGAWLALPASNSGNVEVPGTLTVVGATTLESTLTVDGLATFAEDIVMDGTGELQVPSGTTAERSATPANGMIRYNSSTGQFEGFGAAGWQPLAGSAAASIFPGNIYGLVPSALTGTSTTASATVSAGAATDSLAVAVLSLAAPGSWSVANGNAINGYQGGTTLPDNATIHIFLVTGTAGTGLFGSTSETAPVLPSGYALFRRIFSFTTGSGGSTTPYTADETAGGALTCFFTTNFPTDLNVTAPTASRTLETFSVPTGVRMGWVGIIQPGGTGVIIFTSPDEPDVAASYATAYDVYFDGTRLFTAPPSRPKITNTSAQLGVRASAAITVTASTFGFVDFRRS